MPVKIPTDEILKIPFLDSKNLGNRVITTLTFYEKGEWHSWLVMPDGKLIKLKAIPVEDIYFARAPEKPEDIFFGYLNLMTQQACFPIVIGTIYGLRNDLYNLGASLAKLRLFYEISKERKDKHNNIRRFVSTEVEYIIFVCRSVFDLLQKTIADLWDIITFIDKPKSRRHLPQSFREMILRDNILMSPDDIITRYDIIEPLAKFYHRQGPFFVRLRKYRDDISHRGKEVEIIFVTERGFAVQADTQPFTSFGVWKDEQMLPGNLASLRTAIAYVINETFKACEEFAMIMKDTIKMPPEIAPGFQLFIRGCNNNELIAIKDILDKCLWWD